MVVLLFQEKQLIFLEKMLFFKFSIHFGSLNSFSGGQEMSTVLQLRQYDIRTKQIE